MQNTLLKMEDAVFRFINVDCASPWLNTPMMVLREASTWIPLYILLLIFFIVRYKKQTPLIILFTLVCFALTDFTSAQLLKPFIGRIRPCHQNQLSFALNNIAGCGGMFSFPSSHASNHFGLATFWFLLINRFSLKKWWWLFVWAASICFAQVYVGVHYPGDVLGGAIFGILTGLLCFSIFKNIRKRKKIEPLAQPA